MLHSINEKEFEPTNYLISKKKKKERGAGGSTGKAHSAAERAAALTKL